MAAEACQIGHQFSGFARRLVARLGLRRYRQGRRQCGGSVVEREQSGVDGINLRRRESILWHLQSLSKRARLLDLGRNVIGKCTLHARKKYELRDGLTSDRKSTRLNSSHL